MFKNSISVLESIYWRQTQIWPILPYCLQLTEAAGNLSFPCSMMSVSQHGSNASVSKNKIDPVVAVCRGNCTVQEKQRHAACGGHHMSHGFKVYLYILNHHILIIILKKCTYGQKHIYCSHTLRICSYMNYW